MTEETAILNFQPRTEDVDKRLDVFLSENIADWSRSRLQKLIEEGDATVNGKQSKPSYKLRAGDEIEVELAEIPLEKFVPEDIPLDVVYEDENFAVIDKPAGLVVHPGAGVRSGTLANAIAFHFGFRISDFGLEGGEEKERSGGDEKIRSEGEEEIRNPKSEIRNRVGIVHRLDKNTSGLIVVAKNETTHDNLSRQFRRREVFKSYLALVHGRIETQIGKIDAPLARDPRQRTKMAIVRGGREALTLWTVRQRYERFTLLDVEIKTGRTHQIRVHLASIKHPVVGDETYNAGRDKTVTDARVRQAIEGLDRFFLHAERLSFAHPVTGQKMDFRAPLPAELTNLLELL